MPHPHTTQASTFSSLSIECSLYFTIVYSIIQAIQHLLHHVLLGTMCTTSVRLRFITCYVIQQ